MKKNFLILILIIPCINFCAQDNVKALKERYQTLINFFPKAKTPKDFFDLNDTMNRLWHDISEEAQNPHSSSALNAEFHSLKHMSKTFYRLRLNLYTDDYQEGQQQILDSIFGQRIQ